MTKRTSPRSNNSLLLVLLASTALSTACKGKPPPQMLATASATASAAPVASAAPATSTVPAAASAEAVVTGTGVALFDPIGPACKVGKDDIGEYLQRGELTLAARENAVATAWLVQIPKKPSAQIAFAGFDGDAKQLARARSVGAAKEHAPRVFPSGPDWVVTWFDDKGLAYARPHWDPQPPPKIEHLGAVASDDADDVGLAVTPNGALVAVAPIGASASQLSLFLFAPVEADAPAVKAIGVTHHAAKPTRPAIMTDARGYTLVWLEEGGRIASSFFDQSGKETDATGTVAPPGDAKRDRLALVPTSAGALAFWQEGETIRARALDKTGLPSSPISVIAKGKWAAVTRAGEGALVGFVANEGKPDDEFLVVRVAANAVPAEKGLRVVEAVKDLPTLAIAGSRLALAWMEPMSSTVATKRATLRTIEEACVP